MSDSGLKRFLGQGIRFAVSKAAATYVGMRATGSPATSFYLNLPTTLPGATQAVTVDASGNMGYASLGAGGTVTSVAVAVPADMTATAAITTSGTITISRNSQAAALFLGSPAGATGVPTYRALVATDIPTLTASKISDFDTQVRVSRLDQMAVPTAPLNLNSQRLTGVADPTSSQDAATKAYVDSVAQGIDIKASAKAASTANVSLAAPGAAIDGVTLAATDRVLLKNQTTASENGLWIFNGAAAPMTRATDADNGTKLNSGAFVFVEQGTANSDTGWVMTTDGAITIGSTALTWTQFSGAGSFVDGNGLVLTGNVLDIVGTANRIVATANSLDIDANYAGQTSITTLGTIGTGVWNGTEISVAKGGTGATTATAARTNLSAAGIFRAAFTNSALTSGLLTVTHNLGNKYVQVHVYDENDKRIMDVDDVTGTTTTAATIDLTSFGTLTGTWNVVVVG